MILSKHKDIDGIKIFNNDVDKDNLDYNAKGLDNLYQSEEKHFWFIARKEFILQNIKKHILKDTKIIEIGAGTGNVARYLMQNGYNDISVGEMHLNGLVYAKQYGIKECYQFDLLKAPFSHEFDTVCLFDVLEHIKDDDAVFQNIHKMLKNNGSLVLTVPSHMWLWSREDSIAGHKIRYTKKILLEKLTKNNFEIIENRYFFMSIVPLLWLRTLLRKDCQSNITEEEYSNAISINPFINTILLGLSRIENKINRYLPNLFGGSLFVIARKNDTIQ